MALEATFQNLSVSLHKLHDALKALQVTIDDAPHDESALADGLENTVLDMLGTLHETRKSALLGRKAVAAPTDLDWARRALTTCQERSHHIEQQFATDLVSYEKLKELARLGRERPAWLPWSSTVKLGIEQCREPLDQTSKALAACWQELAERLGTISISVKNTTVGQHIEVPKRGVTDLEIEVT
jgi:hypothetical protein